MLSGLQLLILAVVYVVWGKISSHATSCGMVTEFPEFNPLKEF
jgi:hypothetical protein